MTTKKSRMEIQRKWRQKYRPTIIDMAILTELPPEGTHLGLHQIGVTAPAILEQLQTKYGENGMGISTVTGRLVALCHSAHGLAASVQLIPASQGLGYQITDKGKTLLAENKHLLEEVTGDSTGSQS